MATFRKRGGRIQVQIRRLNFPTQSKSFTSNAAAKAWARRIETSMDDGSWVNTRKTQAVLVNAITDDLILSYERFNLPVAGPKLSSLRQIADHFEGVSIHDLTVEDVLLFAAERRSKVTASTLQKQMYYFRQVVSNSRIKLAENVVQIAIDELIKKKIILSSVWRDRRLAPGEYELLMGGAKNHWIRHAIDIAIASGMRQGEIHALKMSDIDFDKGVIKVLRKDKTAENGKSLCKVPLLKGMREAILCAQSEIGTRDNLFAVKHAASISDKFARLRTSVGIKDLTYHDLRHEAITAMFERGMAAEQVCVVSGHTNLEQLSRYVNLRAEDVAAKY